MTIKIEPLPRAVRCAAAAVMVLVPLGGAPAVLRGQERERVEPNVDPRFEKSERERWIDFCREQAASYAFHLGADRDRRLTFHETPVLVYTNPVGERGPTHGAAFVWTREGRSEVVGAVWALANTPGPNQRTVSHEFHSLSAEPVTAERGGEVVWSTTGPGVRWIDARAAPPPASSEFARLAQMRNVARGLSVTRHDDRNQSEEVLRLLPQPLYRYQPAAASPADGALFACCAAWDPEVLVVVESRDAGLGPRWVYAPVRFSHLTLRVRHLDQEIWSDVRGEPSHRDPARGYRLFFRTSVEPG